MLKRIVTAIVALLLFVPILLWGGSIVVTSVFALIAAVSVYEMLGCCNLNKNIFVAVPSILGAAICVFVPGLFGLRLFAAAAVMLSGVICALIYFLGVSVFAHKSVDVERLFTCFGLTVYITAGFTALSALYIIYGLWAVAFVLCVAWGTDTFAYFSGMLFGKRKLCPEISPKKTIAGAIGGTIFGTAIGVLVFVINGVSPVFALCALPLSVISQLGDLAASVIKRRFGVKDYGKIFPGHGGVLDRFDSIIPVSIVTAMIFLGYWIFVWVL
ncbi:MAG: hypothetical protein E7586_01400 [Ruminococcaceae bacterium]|nr:hypothetical protein [Oscillospiraceae bacterium]